MNAAGSFYPFRKSDGSMRCIAMVESKMLLNDRDYIELIATSLSDDVLKEVGDPSARATVQMSIDGLLEIIKRGELLPRLVAELAPSGIALAERMAAFVEVVTPMPAIPDLAQSSTRDGFGTLMAWLDQAGKRLLEIDRKPASAQERTIAGLLRELAEWELRYFSTFASAPTPVIPPVNERGQLTAEKFAQHIRDMPGYEESEITGFRLNPGGYTNSTFFATLSQPGAGDQHLVIRKRSPNPWFDFWAFRATDEFEIVRRLSDAGLPVAKPLWLFRDRPDIDADYYVMTRSEGTVAGSLQDAYGGGGKISEKILLGLAEFLAKLHSLPLEYFADYLENGDTPVQIGDTAADASRKNIDFMHRFWLQSRRGPSPSEAYMIDWLSRNVPPNQNPPVLVHGDCFVHNILKDADDNIVMVADWESAHFGDAAEDLAYIIDAVSQLMDWDKFMAHYRACGGAEIDPQSLDYFKASLNFRNGIGANIGVRRIKDGYRDIRMIPLGSAFYTAFLQQELEATKSRM